MGAATRPGLLATGLSMLLAAAGPVCADQTLPVFDLHLVVLTRHADAQRIATLEQLRREVDILNSHFVTASRQPIVRFRFKSAALHAAVKDSPCQFVALGDAARPLDGDQAAALFNACDDRHVRDPQAINIYVVDSFAAATGFADTTGHGRRNANRPFLMLDWQRLNHGAQSPEEHEMGHAFGLAHECVPGATPATSTNIMASAECGQGSGGRRDIGFNAQQVSTILLQARRIAERLRGP